MYRYRSKQKEYDKLLKAEGCPFCEPDNHLLNPHPRKRIEETAHMQVVTNSFPYDVWEQVPVKEHLMLIPRRHVAALAELTADERHEYMDLVCAYEAKGYSVYTRAPRNAIRTVAHLHTHLIRLDACEPHGFISIEKPYILVRW
jgi:diadenosine tetraphosphate (Ap4A) HIT family hydrolase